MSQRLGVAPDCRDALATELFSIVLSPLLAADIPRIGPCRYLGGCSSARTLTAEPPKLGTLDRRRIASLVGIGIAPPVGRDSGTLRGRRMVMGGRASVRAARASSGPAETGDPLDPLARDIEIAVLPRLISRSWRIARRTANSLAPAPRNVRPRISIHVAGTSRNFRA